MESIFIDLLIIGVAFLCGTTAFPADQHIHKIYAAALSDDTPYQIYESTSWESVTDISKTYNHIADANDTLIVEKIFDPSETSLASLEESEESSGTEAPDETFVGCRNVSELEEQKKQREENKEPETIMTETYISIVTEDDHFVTTEMSIEQSVSMRFDHPAPGSEHQETKQEQTIMSE